MPEELEIKMVRLETIVGDKDSGLVADIHKIKTDIEDLKKFRWQLFGSITFMMFVMQVAGLAVIKQLLGK
jgi:hypothetical protein